MHPIVMSNTYGEREGVVTLENAWVILGGQPCSGLCGYVEDLVNFEMNQEYTLIIEKKAEDLYRSISQKMKVLPSSNQAIKQTVLRTQSMDLTPQESEQLSKYVSDDSYVKKQKDDIEELASMFKDILGKSSEEEDKMYIKEFESHFMPEIGFRASYLFMIEGKKQPLCLDVKDDELTCSYGNRENIDVYAKLNADVMSSIVNGRMTFQRAFMTGVMTAKGNFKTLRMLDTLFNFEGN